MPSKKMPLSPALSNSGEIFQHGLHHIVQHNANSHYPQDHYQHDEGVHLHSNYGSPAPGQEVAYGYRGPQQRYVYQQHMHQDSGLGSIQYDNFMPEYQTPGYQDQYSTPASSPPTPSNQDVMRTRSGYGIQRTHHNLRPMPEGRPRADKSPKPKRVKKTKLKAEKKVAKLDKPLSELTKDWKHVPVADIDAYVNRSAEDRRKEVEQGKIPGKVKRPMNSFMLYRKAYQNRTKDWCLQNNHQVVSQVCGDSWPLEPEEVKEQFNEWARIERQNHQNAHPGYKFSPSKPEKPAGKRKPSEDLSEESDLDDFEWQGGSTRRQAKKQRPAPRPDQPVVYPTTRSAYHYSSRDSSVEPDHGGYNQSSFQANNPGRPMPAPYNQANLHHGEYYQQSVQKNPAIPDVEDVIIRKATAPGVQPLTSIPGGHDFDMMNPYPQYNLPPGPGPEHRVNHSLMGHDQHIYNGASYGEQGEGMYFGSHQIGGQHQHWQSPQGLIERNRYDPMLNFIDPELDSGQIQDPHAHILKGHQTGWHVESLDGGTEFEKWPLGEE